MAAGKTIAKIKRFFTAPRREWPWAFAARNILVLGAAFWGMFAAIAVVNPPIPAYGELAAETGTYQGLERQSGGSYHLMFTTEQGYTDRCLIDSFVEFDQYAFLDAVSSDGEIALRYVPDEYRTVMELTAAGKTFLTYEQVRQATWNNNYLGMLVIPPLTAAAMAASWLWFRLTRRKEKPVPEKEEAPARTASFRYAPSEREEVEAYISRAFGKPGRIYYDATQVECPVDIALIPPTEREDFWRLVTIGMGARRMEVPPELRETNRAFAELAVFLPPDWDPETGDPWPFQWLRRAAGASWLQAGTVFSGHVGSGYTAVLIGWPAVREDCAGRVILDSGKVINFYQLYPLLPGEDAYRKLRGVQRLWGRMMENGVSPIVYSSRESWCGSEEWYDEEIAPFAVEEKDGVWYGWLHMKGRGPFYRDEPYPQDAEGWRELCRRFCEAYGWQGLALQRQEDIFYITVTDEEILRSFLLAFHDFCDVPKQVAELLGEETP